MERIKTLLRIIDFISEWIGKMVSFLVIVIIGVTIWEVVLRYVFNAPTIWAFDAAYLIFGAYGVLGGAYTLYLRGHVNVDILYGRLSLRRRAIVDLVTSIFFFLFCGLLLWKGGEMAWDSLKIMERGSSAWNPPIYPIKLTIPLGAFLLLIQGVAKFIRDLMMAATGKEVA
ncbi:MAG: TRAP transporter small permease subunit [Deltaproteobacteria bacterium]|nr:TRAP transporter small permease subunit [Deltaproteobacteria bacterium]